MSTPPNSRRELANTYIVQDLSNQEEMTRLRIQGQMLTAAMGGPLPEQPDPTRFRCILDMGCGTGDWIIEMARTYPEIPKLIGADISSTMIEYARAQAQAQQIDDRVEFHVMDALRMIEFPPDFFDLVNHRMAESFVRTWEWTKLLGEYKRVTRPGGIIRLTELDADIQSTSTALSRLTGLFIQALSQSGHTFLSDRWGNTDELIPLLTRHSFQQVQRQEHTITFRAGTTEGQYFYEDMAKMYQTILPFLKRWLRLPDDYDQIYQQALQEMQQPDFVTIWHMPTIWGIVPPKQRPTSRAEL